MLLEPSEYRIVNASKPIIKKDEALNIDKVKFICKDCEATIYVKDYDTIVYMEKVCVCCKNKRAAVLRKETMKNNKEARDEKAIIGN